MTASRDDATSAALAQLLETHGLRGETRLYREVMRDAMAPRKRRASFGCRRMRRRVSR
jgi:hypothetical protein